MGGLHYKGTKIQHWDYVAANNLDYFQGQVTKYVTRWKDKGGLQDLQKAKHFLDKYIEMEENRLRYHREILKGGETGPIEQDKDLSAEPGRGYVNQDPS